MSDTEDEVWNVAAYSPVGPVRCPRCKTPAADVPVGDRSCRVCGATESDGRAPDLRMLAGDRHGAISWLVVICREGVTETTTFEDESDARTFYGSASEQWSDSFLCKVAKGPLV
ncbi:hypothetical protein WMF38_57000 [Sorangium sp. So ce118]